MNRDEKIVEYYLRNLKIGDVHHEPDGKIPPDFAIDNRIGVEVRRLNQHFVSVDTIEGLEIISIPLINVIKEVLASFNSKYQGTSYWVGFEFKRQLKKRMKDVKKEIYDSLIEFLINDTVPPSIVQVNEEITLLIYPSKPIQGRIFRLMGSTDEDAGGAVIQMYVDNIRHCLSEKNSKVEPHKSKYKDWWLFLVDHISWNLDQGEVADVKSQLTDFGAFKRVCILSFDGQKILLEL